MTSHSVPVAMPAALYHSTVIATSKTNKLLRTPKSKPVKSAPKKSKARVHTNRNKVAKWTQDDDDKLRRSVIKHDEKNWKAIARDAFGTAKSDVQCLHRWRKVLDPNIKKGPWTEHEDALILHYIKVFGEGKWSDIAKYVPGRLGKQCRERWINHLDPTILKTPFTEHEDKRIIELYAKFGTKWTQIRKYLPGRTDNAIKNRFYSHLRRHVTVQAPKKALANKPKIKASTSSKKRKIDLGKKVVTKLPVCVPVSDNLVREAAECLRTLKGRGNQFSIENAISGAQASSTNAFLKTPADFSIPLAPETPPVKRRQSFSPMLKVRHSKDLIFNPFPSSKDSPNTSFNTSFSSSHTRDSPFGANFRWNQMYPLGSPGPPTPISISRSPIGSILGYTPPPKTPTLSQSITSPPPKTALEMSMSASPHPRTPDYKGFLPSTLSSPCPPITPLGHKGRNLIDMMDDEHDKHGDSEISFSSNTENIAPRTNALEDEGSLGYEGAKSF